MKKLLFLIIIAALSAHSLHSMNRTRGFSARSLLSHYVPRHSTSVGFSYLKTAPVLTSFSSRPSRFFSNSQMSSFNPKGWLTKASKWLRGGQENSQKQESSKKLAQKQELPLAAIGEKFHTFNTAGLMDLLYHAAGSASLGKRDQHERHKRYVALTEKERNLETERERLIDEINNGQAKGLTFVSIDKKIAQFQKSLKRATAEEQDRVLRILKKWLVARSKSSIMKQLLLGDQAEFKDDLVAFKNELKWSEIYNDSSVNKRYVSLNLISEGFLTNLFSLIAKATYLKKIAQLQQRSEYDSLLKEDRDLGMITQILINEISNGLSTGLASAPITSKIAQFHKRLEQATTEEKDEALNIVEQWLVDITTDFAPMALAFLEDITNSPDTLAQFQKGLKLARSEDKDAILKALGQLFIKLGNKHEKELQEVDQVKESD